MIATKHDYEVLDGLLHEYERRVVPETKEGELTDRIAGVAIVEHLTTGVRTVYSLTTSGWQQIIT